MAESIDTYLVVLIFVLINAIICLWLLISFSCRRCSNRRPVILALCIASPALLSAAHSQEKKPAAGDYGSDVSSDQRAEMNGSHKALVAPKTPSQTDEGAPTRQSASIGQHPSPALPPPLVPTTGASSLPEASRVPAPIGYVVTPQQWAADASCASTSPVRAALAAPVAVPCVRILATTVVMVALAYLAAFLLCSAIFAIAVSVPSIANSVSFAPVVASDCGEGPPSDSDGVCNRTAGGDGVSFCCSYDFVADGVPEGLGGVRVWFNEQGEVSAGTRTSTHRTAAGTLDGPTRRLASRPIRAVGDVRRNGGRLALAVVGALPWNLTQRFFSARERRRRRRWRPRRRVGRHCQQYLQGVVGVGRAR
eukprot:TRINITY_DN56876_c0_g1_i1.p1 TRINITY_DN56876_c0_g1~~TRINITY_DN56876_c0_g1_i1.p1  ORF type:complete len:365 (+),score=31.18 TRINITY_DN56876_c0_g1_i1:104-1198(+)